MKSELKNNQLLGPSVDIIKPQIRPEILMARGGDVSIKLFYAMMREAREKGINILDIGSSVKVGDVEFPLATQVVDWAHKESKARGLYTEYASSWGTMDLRLAITDYFADWGGVDLDPKTETMVSRGIMDSYDRTIRAFDWKGVIVPDWAPYYARSKATINRLPIINVPIDLNTGNLRLDVLEQVFQEQGIDPHGLLMYITHPAAPVGTVMDDNFIENHLIPFCRNNGVILFSDSYISATQFDGRRLRPILSYNGAKDVCVEAITVAKELGLPGARAGGIAGNEYIINGIRLLAATEVDIVPGPSQILAARALKQIRPEIVSQRIQSELENEILPRLTDMGWPFLKPKAGIDMVIAVPPGFRRDNIENPSLLAAVAILRHYGVAMCPGSVFGPDGKYALRLVLKQKEGEIAGALDKMRNEGFCWKTEEPTAEDITFLNKELARLDLTRL
jgi:aspartate/methionine/tyrosine aminotransferase